MTEEQVRKLQEKVATLEAKVQLQEDLIAALLKKLYGVKSEKIDTN